MFRGLALCVAVLIASAWAANERRIVLVAGRDGGIETADGQPMFGAVFVFNEPDGKMTLAAADLRNTVLDFQRLPRPREGITLARVDVESDASFSAFLRTAKVAAVYIDQDHIVYPSDSRRIAADGPFLDIVFTSKKERKSPAAGVDIEVLDGKRLLARASRRPDGSYLATIRAIRGPVLRIRATNRTTGGVWERKLPVPLKSAAPSLIEYFGIELGL